MSEPDTAYLCRKCGVVFLSLRVTKSHEKKRGCETEAYRIKRQPTGEGW